MPLNDNLECDAGFVGNYGECLPLRGNIINNIMPERRLSAVLAVDQITQNSGEGHFTVLS